MDQESPARPSPRTKTLNTLVVGIQAVVLALLAILTTYVRARFQRVFADFNVTLPPTTQWIMDIAPAAFPLFCVGLAVGLLLKDLVVRDPSTALRVNVVVALGLFCLLAVVALTLLLPMVSLNEKLSS
jgi:hypothetical protein